MRICVLQSSYEGSTGETQGLDPYYDPARWLSGHTVEQVLIRKATAVQQIRALADQGYNVFLNLCEGAWDEDRAGLEAVQALERFGLAFTGASSAFYEPSKAQMKQAASFAGVPTAAFAFVHDDAGIEAAARELTFPLIVKHHNGYSSVGMTRDSRVTDASQLRVQARRMIDSYGGALVEEFIDGPEFTVLVAENPEEPSQPLAFVPVECAFPKGETFKHFDLKWVDYAGLQWQPCPDPAAAERLKEYARRIFMALNGVSYARCDFRMDRNGTPYFLEINPNCGIFYPPGAEASADCILLADPIGHRGFLEHILRAAILRRERRVPRVESWFRKGAGYELRANRDLKAGELIKAGQGPGPFLATSPETFWPLAAEGWVQWSDDPLDRTPVTHSCEPNAWLQGIDVIARRDIRRGELVTLDTATFSEAGVCTCSPDELARYRGHYSPWVQARQQ